MVDVSRETAPDEPDPELVAALFPSARRGVAEEYAALLASQGVLRGLIGPREVPRLWDRHLVNCALLAPLVPTDAVVADLGSGAGLPGLVVAIARPDVQMTLVEPMARRTAFLEEAVHLLGLANVEVVRGRAENWTRPDRFDVVTARALAPLPQLLRWALPLVTPGGAVLAMKGSSARDEIDASQAELCRAKAEAEVLHPEVAGARSTVVKVVPRVATTIGWPADPPPRSGQADSQRRARERRRR